MYVTMDVGLQRWESDLPDLINSPFGVWVRDAIEVTYDQVRRHSGQVVQRQKRLYDWKAVRRLFAVGDWVLRYYSPAKKCKLDSAWVGPYLIVSLAGWALGIQRHPDSPIVLVHCQDLKKISWPSGMVPCIEAPRPKGASTIPMFGVRTKACTSHDSLSIAVLPPKEGAVRADVFSVASAGSSSGSRADCPNASGMNVSSALLDSAVVPFSHTVLQVDVSCDLHPFFEHKMDSGYVRQMTIAHAFNYRVGVLRDGIKSAIRVGRSHKAEGRFLTETNISWGHQVAVMFQIISKLALEVRPSYSSWTKCPLMSNYIVSRRDM